ncbi:SRPBCC domain-containing protein [Nonomuraea fuscirosea]|uniref:SRPBCC domain-containing protein n=1 Tax=Nonomuraea fuscirosea TaxID=1291556 RepID=UPI00371B3EB7
MIKHATFVAEHVYTLPPVEVFSAWADPVVKARWAGGPTGWSPRLELDFRVDGLERYHGGPPGGPAHTLQARYLDIVASRRIVYSYDVLLDQVRVLVSLATVEFARHGPGTRLVHTEQAAFLTGDDTSPFERHMHAALKSLAAELHDSAPLEAEPDGSAWLEVEPSGPAAQAAVMEPGGSAAQAVLMEPGGRAVQVTVAEERS